MVEIWQLFISNFYPNLRDISNLEEKFSKDRIQLNSSKNFCKRRIQFSSNSSENFSKNRIQFSSGSENLSKDRIQFSSGSKNLLNDSIQFGGSSQMSSEGEFVNRDYVFVVNPTGGNGRTGRDWQKLLPLLHSRLGKSWNVREALTTGPLHAIELAREAVQNGAAAVVAVGGDGTLNEVLNGFFKDGEAFHPQEVQAGPRTAIGLIPMGTGSDFARHFGWNVNDMNQAVDRLVMGNKRKMDVGRVVLVDDKVDRYFLNVASLHLSAKAGARVAKYKRLGNLSYVLGALDAFRDHQNRNLKVRVDGGEWRAVPDVSAICIGNAKYFGGGMKITPTADPFSGKLEVVTLRDFKWYDFVTKMHALYAGSHIQLKNVSKESVSTIEVDEETEAGRREVYVQADGEHIGFLRASFSVLPGKIDFIV